MSRKAFSYIIVEIRADYIEDAAREAYRIAIAVGTGVHFRFGGKKCTVNFRDVLVDEDSLDVRVASFVSSYKWAVEEGRTEVID